MPYQITGHTRLGGLIGTPVAHSLSPTIHNTGFQALDIDFVYVCFDIDPGKLAHTVQTLRDINTYGFNLTMPCKTDILPYLDELSPAARLIGAVNTVNNENGRLVGYNVDGQGFMKAVREEGLDIKGKTMTLLGAGGAANAVAVQAALDGAECIHLVSRRSRSWERAVDLAKRINENTACHADLTDLADTAALKKLLEESALLVNATSAGMAPTVDATPLPDTSLLLPHLLVGDVIYNPSQTRFLREAAAAGCRTFNGVPMLLYQGEACFKIWTGQDLPVELVRGKLFGD